MELVTETTRPTAPDRRDELLASLEPLALDAVRAAALAARHRSGRGDGKAADAAATTAMRTALNRGRGTGTVVIGEGEKDAAPMLFNGEALGLGGEPRYDIAVDPLECTDLCAAGLEGSLTTIALAAEGGLWSPGAAHYMDKIVVGAAARGAVHLGEEPEDNVRSLAAALGKPVRDVRIVVLDKPRHAELVSRLHATGARVVLVPAGDVAGALLAVLPDTGVDMLLGIGGTPEGVMSACAVKALGGEMQGRLAPQRAPEAQGLAEAGRSTTEILGVDDLVTGPAVFAATGVTGGTLLRAPWRHGAYVFTESLVVREGVVRWIVQASPDDEQE
jgi:fructose-1,6-bisphosphatase II